MASHPRLVERVGTSTPPGQEQAETDSFEDAGHSTNCNRVEGSLFSEDLADELYNISVHMKEIKSWHRDIGLHQGRS